MIILACLSHHLIKLPPNGKFLLFSDSLSSLRSLLYNANPLVQRIHPTLLSLNSINTKVIFIWIPGHINIYQNTMLSTWQLNRIPLQEKSLITKKYQPPTIKTITVLVSQNHGILHGKTNRPINSFTLSDYLLRGHPPIETQGETENRPHTFLSNQSQFTVFTNLSTLPRRKPLIPLNTIHR